MLNGRLKVAALSLAMSLAIIGILTGCGSSKEDEAQQTERKTETETEIRPEVVTETEKESETQSEVQTDVAYTSQDRSIRIILPDSTWKVTQDVDEMRVFSSGSAAMINVVHAADAAAMKKISVSESEEALKASLTKQYPDANAFEVIAFEKLSSTTLDTYEYIVKYNSTSMWAYSVTYGIIAQNEAYVITGTVLDDNKVLLDAVQKAVESFTVLRNSTFSALPGTVTNQNGSESQMQSESSQGVEAELNSLTDYGTSTTLYASDNVNIRIQPSTDTNILGALYTGDKVTVIGETSQWFKVNVNGNVGYVSKAFLVSTPTTPPTQTQGTEAPVSDSTKTAAELNSYIDYGTSYTYYATTDVNLRAQPGTDSGVVGGVSTGTTVSVIGETDNWFVVSVNGVTGYVSKSYVSSTNPGTTTNNGGDTETGTGTGGGQGSSVGTVSGTIVGANSNTITIQGDDGNTYNVNYTDASVNTSNGLQSGLYITATVDYSSTSPTGELYATAVSGH